MADTANRNARRRLPLIAGILLVVSGIVAYALQLRWGILFVPWYAPVLATLGVAIMLLAAVRRPNVWRGTLVALFALLCGLEWYFLLVESRLPAYMGPAQSGARLPPFTGQLASGQVFSSESLESGEQTVLVFFRGRW